VNPRKQAVIVALAGLLLVAALITAGVLPSLTSSAEHNSRPDSWAISGPHLATLLASRVRAI